MLDRNLIDALDGINGDPYDGFAWRVSWTARDPLASSSGGGRWAPEGRFDVLYTALEANGALSEVYYHLSRAPIFSSSDMTINKIRVMLSNVLRLDSKLLDEMKIGDPLSSKKLRPTQLVGETAYMLDFNGLRVPSARSVGEKLVIFRDVLGHECEMEVLSTEPVNWPAWKKSQE